MGAQGTTTVDFGTFPGKSDASVDVTGQAAIVGTSLVEAWLYPAPTADHSADEHLLETMKVVAGNIVAGVGFTIYALNTSQLNEPLQSAGAGHPKNGLGAPGTVSQPARGFAPAERGGMGTRLYGQWTVAWVWN
ncbi:MAG: hypothetical protein JNM17_13200 [Archangium sp.]|nr:hypothetical protein [Archangium sp.]